MAAVKILDDLSFDVLKDIGLLERQSLKALPASRSLREPDAQRSSLAEVSSIEGCRAAASSKSRQGGVTDQKMPELSNVLANAEGAGKAA